MGEGDGGSARVVALRPSQEEHYARIGRPIVREVAERLARQLGGRVPESDLESLGNEALVRLIRRYDPEAAPLVPFLRRYLRWAILDKVRGSRVAERTARRARALAAVSAVNDAEDSVGVLDAQQLRERFAQALSRRALAMTLPLAQADERAVEPSCDSSRAPDRALVRATYARALRLAISAIEDDVARSVVVRHYFGDEPFDQIAADLALSVHQICRIHRRALSELQRNLGRADIGRAGY